MIKHKKNIKLFNVYSESEVGSRVGQGEGHKRIRHSGAVPKPMPVKNIIVVLIVTVVIMRII